MGAVRNARLRNRFTGLVVGLLWIAVFAGTVACRVSTRAGALSPPHGSAPWKSEHAELFDDGITVTPPRFDGRAPNDVLDQQLFQRRLGHADVVVLARVEQVWGKGRYEGKPEQFVVVDLGEILLGDLSRSTSDRQLLHVASATDLPGSLPGTVMILFLRWAPSDEPPFHHHLTVAAPGAIRLVEAMIDHARAEGALGRDGTPSRRKRRKALRAAASSSAKKEDR